MSRAGPLAEAAFEISAPSFDTGFSEMKESYRRAERADDVGVQTAAINLAGRSGTISFVGAGLAHYLAPAFHHLTDTGAQLETRQGPTIKLWDEAESRVQRPALPPQEEWSSRGDGWRAASYGNARYICEERSRSLMWLDRKTADIVGCFADSRSLTFSDRARPLQRMMSAFCDALGIQDVHAGLVSREGHGVLIVGGSGRGKTTTAIDGFYGGMDFLGDDSVGVGIGEAGGFIGYSLYGSARILPAQIGRWPDLADHWLRPDPTEDKALLFPSGIEPSRMIRQTRIVAIAVPFVGDGRLAVARTSPRDAFAALAFDSREGRRFGTSAVNFARLVALTKTIPCYRFEVDADPGRVTEGLLGLLQESGA